MASELALDLLERRAWMRGRPRQGQPPQEKIPTSCVERGGEVMAMQDSPRRPIPIRQRRLDLLFVAFFLLNFGFITYVVDLEQVVIAGPARFSYPLWPPAPLSIWSTGTGRPLTTPPGRPSSQQGDQLVGLLARLRRLDPGGPWRAAGPNLPICRFSVATVSSSDGVRIGQRYSRDTGLSPWLGGPR
jgi:hypothetical protein